MEYEDLIERLNADSCAALRRAIELGKFPDGRRLTDAQRELCLEAVIAWELRHLPPEQRIGYIDRGSKAEGESCGSGGGEGHDHNHPHDEPQPFEIRKHSH